MSKPNIIAKGKLIFHAPETELVTGSHTITKLAYFHTYNFHISKYQPSVSCLTATRFESLFPGDTFLLSVDNSKPRKLNYDFIAFQQRKTDESLLQILRQIYRFAIKRISVSFNLTCDFPSSFLGHWFRRLVSLLLAPRNEKPYGHRETLWWNRSS